MNVAATLAIGLLPACLMADITGVVLDSRQRPVSNAFVRFVASTDSTIDAHAFTDSLGRYSINLSGLMGARGARPPQAISNGPGAFYSLRNRPNPFSRSTTISFIVDNSGPVVLSIFSTQGKLVKEFRTAMAPGTGSMVWDRTDASGRMVADGLYVCRLRQGVREVRNTMMVNGSCRPTVPSAGPSAAFSKKAAADFHVLVYGKGIFPLKQSNVSVTDGMSENFTLPHVDLWDSSRTILRDDFTNCQSVFRTTGKGRVVFLGGSITYNPGWRDSVMNCMRIRFPQTIFTFVNAGIPSIGSDMHAFRIRRDVFSSGKVDLLFVESAVNDTINNIRDNINRTARFRATEGIFRQARANNPAIDIVTIYFADDVFYSPVQVSDSIPFLTCYETPAWNYGVTCINLAQYVAERYTWSQFGGDVHPAAFGTQIYAEVFKSFLNAVWTDSLPIGKQAVPHCTPVEPLDSLCYQYGLYDSITTASLLSGWSYVPSWHPADNAATRDGFVNVPAIVATAPGSTFTFIFTGTAVGIVSPEGPDVGIINYQIDGVERAPLDQFTTVSSAVHVPWIWMFATDLAYKTHSLTCTMASEKNSASVGYASRIFEFAVNGK